MNLFVLSELHPANNHVGWSINYSLEETLASACNATFIYPQGHSRVSIVNRCKYRIFKSWFEIKDLPTLGKEPNILLIIGLSPYFMLSMHGLGSLLKQFDLRLGYILDGFDPRHLDREVISHLDHLFVISAEVADEINDRRILSTTFLPLATSIYHSGSSNLSSAFQPRWIDIINYGRSDAELHQCLQTHFDQPDNHRVYFHSTFSRPEVNNQREHIALLRKLLRCSKISLCFEASKIGRFRGYSPILYRWFEAWAAGCTIVGKRPFGKGVAELMDWENSAIEIPDAPSDWIPFFEALLSDNETLIANTQRNYREALLRHDWRYRLKDMFTLLNLPTPTTLDDQISQLKEKAYMADYSPKVPA